MFCPFPFFYVLFKALSYVGLIMTIGLPHTQ